MATTELELERQIDELKTENKRLESLIEERNKELEKAQNSNGRLHDRIADIQEELRNRPPAVKSSSVCVRIDCKCTFCPKQFKRGEFAMETQDILHCSICADPKLRPKSEGL